MVFHGIQIGGFTDDDTHLRAAQELVAAESHDIAASVQHFPDRRFMRQSPCGQIDEQAAADIVDAGQAVVMGQAGQVRSGNTLGKTDDAVITGVNLHESRRIFADGPFVVGQMSLVGRTDFADTAAALFDDVGNPEGAADFDEFPRDTTTSRPAAMLDRVKRTAAALLLTTMASSAPVSSQRSSRTWS